MKPGTFDDDLIRFEDVFGASSSNTVSHSVEDPLLYESISLERSVTPKLLCLIEFDVRLSAVAGESGPAD